MTGVLMLDDAYYWLVLLLLMLGEGGWKRSLALDDRSQMGFTYELLQLWLHITEITAKNTIFVSLTEV